jgi:hypothetical protein
MLNETHRAPPRYKISDFFSSLLETPNVIGNSGFHCRSNAKRLVNAAKQITEDLREIPSP